MLRFVPYIGPKPPLSFKDPDTGHFYKAMTMRELIDQVRSYREQNNLEEIPHLQPILENYLCSLKINQGSCEENPQLRRGWLTYLKGGVSLLKKLFYGDAMIVPQQEADRRGSICLECPANVTPDENYHSWADEIALHSTNGKKSIHHEKLGNCEACSCPLKAKVFYKGPFGLSTQEFVRIQALNPKCWQLPLTSIKKRKE